MNWYKIQEIEHIPGSWNNISILVWSYQFQQEHIPTVRITEHPLSQTYNLQL